MHVCGYLCLMDSREEQHLCFSASAMGKTISQIMNKLDVGIAHLESYEETHLKARHLAPYDVLTSTHISSQPADHLLPPRAWWSG